MTTPPSQPDLPAEIGAIPFIGAPPAADPAFAPSVAPAATPQPAPTPIRPPLDPTPITAARAGADAGLPPEIVLKPTGVIETRIGDVTYTLRRPYIGEVEDFLVEAEVIGKELDEKARELESWASQEVQRAAAAQKADEVFVRATPPVSTLQLRVAGLQSNRRWMEKVYAALSDKPLPDGADAERARPAWFGMAPVVAAFVEHWMHNPLDLGT